MTDHRKERIAQGLCRRLHHAPGEATDFDTDLVSIGAISRLSRFQGDGVADQPYESFRSWLRGLTNASIGMTEQWKHLLDVADYDQDQNGYPQMRVKPKPGTSSLISVDLTPLSGREINHEAAIKPPALPLYRDEIGWLLNERGVISLVQGHLFDAIPLFERALIVMRHATDGDRDDPALHAASRRVRLNLAITHIDRGNLFKARQSWRDCAFRVGCPSIPAR